MGVGGCGAEAWSERPGRAQRAPSPGPWSKTRFKSFQDAVQASEANPGHPKQCPEKRARAKETRRARQEPPRPERDRPAADWRNQRPARGPGHGSCEAHPKHPLALPTGRRLSRCDSRSGLCPVSPFLLCRLSRSRECAMRSRFEPTGVTYRCLWTVLNSPTAPSQRQMPNACCPDCRLYRGAFKRGLGDMVSRYPPPFRSAATTRMVHASRFRLPARQAGRAPLPCSVPARPPSVHVAPPADRRIWRPSIRRFAGARPQCPPQGSEPAGSGTSRPEPSDDRQDSMGCRRSKDALPAQVLPVTNRNLQRTSGACAT